MCCVNINKYLDIYKLKKNIILDAMEVSKMLLICLVKTFKYLINLIDKQDTFLEKPFRWKKDYQ